MSAVFVETVLPFTSLPPFSQDPVNLATAPGYCPPWRRRDYPAQPLDDLGGGQRGGQAVALPGPTAPSARCPRRAAAAARSGRVALLSSG